MKKEKPSLYKKIKKMTRKLKYAELNQPSHFDGNNGKLRQKLIEREKKRRNYKFNEQLNKRLNLNEPAKNTLRKELIQKNNEKRTKRNFLYRLTNKIQNKLSTQPTNQSGKSVFGNLKTKISSKFKNLFKRQNATSNY
jgi:hypothetical protein